jgi:hypothetical protein
LKGGEKRKMGKPQLNVPILFQKLKQFEIADTRFIKVKIWLMHLQENLNGSFFSKEVVQDAIYSLANTPILAYIEDDSDGEKDFSDHRMVLVKEEGQYKIKYIGQAIGVIPETNNAQFEMRLCDDGVEREFLTVEGLVWQDKWDDAPDILNRDMVKAQSMELHSDYEGQFEEDNLFHFTSFKFYGACALGKSVEPAMHNASIEIQFSFDGFTKEIQEKMEQFKQFTLQNQSSSTTEDVDNINFSKKEVNDTLNLDELLAKYNLTQEKLSFSIEGLSIDEIETKIKEQFSLSNNQLLTEINKILQTMTEVRENYWGELVERRSFYLMDLKDEYAIVVTYDWDTYYGIPYSVNGDIVTLDFEAKLEYVPDWRQKQAGDNTLFTNVKEIITSEFAKIKESTDAQVIEVNEKFSTLETEKNEIQTQLNTITTEYEQVKPEIERLKEFEKTTLSTQRQEAEESLFSQFNEQLNNDEQYETLKSEASNYTLEQLEEKCFSILGKKTAQFSIKQPQKSTVKISVGHEDNVDDEPYGGLVSKYLNK